jgi:hypothetical protein
MQIWRLSSILSRLRDSDLGRARVPARRGQVCGVNPADRLICSVLGVENGSRGRDPSLSRKPLLSHNPMKSAIRRALLTAATLTGIACTTSSSLAQDNKPPVPSGNITVSFWGIATQPWQVMIDDFQKTYPNIKVKWTKYSTVDQRFILEDFFAKLARFTKSKSVQ